jgi:hypothetical protein
MQVDLDRFLTLGEGRRFYPGDFSKSEFDIQDIANALSKQCRFNGHCSEFYSVAEHCYWASYYINDNRYMREALMHDASEAYIGDIPRPIKYAIPGLAEYEETLHAAIFKHFDLQYPMPDAVHDIDDRLLVTEVLHLKPDVDISTWGLDKVRPIIDMKIIACWTPAKAEEMFLRRFNTLFNPNWDLYVNQSAA